MLKNQKGQGLAEYALIIAVVAVGIITALGLFRDDIEALLTTIGGAIAGAS